MHAASTEDGPAAGRQSFFRSSHPSAYSDEVEQALLALADRVDVQRCRQIWLEATTTAWPAAPVCAHGDLAVDDLLVQHGRLSAVIDF
ncbi:phosphotransferase [Actinomycetospora endophytica]|uniref:phosphotransferase n=1 Tax=Actinomycetospora endophytica TaxID=2291215 RepID=UPI0035560B56